MGSADAEGYLWATVLEEMAGFAHSPDAKNLQLHAVPHPSDPAAAGLSLRLIVSLLGVDLMSCRRNRVNGWWWTLHRQLFLSPSSKRSVSALATFSGADIQMRVG
jgi:predicted pyridoxine 5'-phosphate oxidase superfamily flavin-nucleotide-binding protein